MDSSKKAYQKIPIWAYNGLLDLLKLGMFKLNNFWVSAMGKQKMVDNMISDYLYIGMKELQQKAILYLYISWVYIMKMVLDFK